MELGLPNNFLDLISTASTSVTAQLAGVITLLLGIALAFWVIHFIIDTLNDISEARQVGMSVPEYRTHMQHIEALRGTVATEAREFSFLEEERQLEATHRRLQKGIAHDLDG